MLIINSFVGLHPVYGTLVLWIRLRSNSAIAPQWCHSSIEAMPSRCRVGLMPRRKNEITARCHLSHGTAAYGLEAARHTGRKNGESNYYFYWQHRSYLEKPI